MVERTPLHCPSDCIFLDLSLAVLKEQLGGFIDEIDETTAIAEECETENVKVKNVYGVDVPCGLAGKMVVAQTIGESRG